MAAASANRKSTRSGDPKFSFVDSRTVEDAVKIYVGVMVEQDDSTLEVAPATDAAAKGILGVSTQYVDNTDDGETLEDISTAVHLMINQGDITKAHIGAIAYAVDDQTVAQAAQSNDNAAGRIVEVTSDGVYVDFDPAKKA